MLPAVLGTDHTVLCLGSHSVTGCDRGDRTKEAFSLHFCLGSGGHTPPSSVPPPSHKDVASPQPGAGGGRAAAGTGCSWAPASGSLPQPGLGRTTQRVISGQFCGYLPRRGGSRCPRHPKYHFGNPSRHRKTNKVEIALAVSRDRRGLRHTHAGQEGALERDQVTPWWGGAR